MRKRNSSSKLTFIPATDVSLRAHPDYDEAWLEKQICRKPQMLGFGTLRIISSQRRQTKGGRLDILAEDEANQYVYVIELMLGSLDSSHIFRAIDYWMRESARSAKPDWAVVAVLIAEDIRGSRYVNVIRFLSEKMPLVIVEMAAMKVGEHLTLKFTKLFDGRDQLEAETTDTVSPDTDEKYWVQKASLETIALTKKCGALLMKFDSNITLNWRQQFIGITVGNRAANFVVFHPKKQFIRVHARSLSDTEGWSRRLSKSGFEILGGTPGRSIHFRVNNENFRKNQRLLQELFRECYEGRFSD